MEKGIRGIIPTVSIYSPLTDRLAVDLRLPTDGLDIIDYLISMYPELAKPRFKVDQRGNTFVKKGCWNFIVCGKIWLC